MADQLPFGDVELATNPEPRCPCVLLLDTSGSMSRVVDGASHIDRVNDGVRAYQTELLADPLAAQRVETSVVTFGGTVQTLAPFATAHQFVPPVLVAGGDTPMGAALVAAVAAVEDRKRLYKQNGLHYYRPWIFLVTDGGPTDAWREAATKVREGEAAKRFAFFAVGVEGADFDVLKQVSVREPLRLKGYSYREMFVWLSHSQRAVSHSNPGQESQVKLDSPAGWASL